MLLPRDCHIVAESVSRSMRSNKSKDTGPELALRRALWAAGVRGYRKHLRALPGTPDVVFTRKRLAVFVHGCFWHRCPTCRKDDVFRTNERFWRSKLEATVLRDEEDRRRLEASGYRVAVVWECEVAGNLGASVERVRRLLVAEAPLTARPDF